jgi:hypothetical protein
MRSNKTFLFFVLSVFSVIVLPQIFRDGMFMDGNLYAAVAVNYARGEGTFWAPHFSKETMMLFHEQPPLMFGILGFCFKIFGEHILVERFYSLFIFLVSLYIFLLIWKNIFPENQTMQGWKWLAVLIWIMIPNTNWAVIHNLEENTMGLFVLLSVYFQIKIVNEKYPLKYLFSMCAGVTLYLAFITKGFPGLFPLIFLPLHYSFFRKGSKNSKFYLMNFIVLILVLLSLIFFSFAVEPSSTQLNAWLNDRVLNSIKNVSNTGHRFEIIIDLMMQLIPVFLIFPVLFLVSKIKKINIILLSNEYKKKALFFLMLAAAGSLPLMITREQRGFYLTTSHPYYAIFFAIIFSPWFNVLSIENWQGKIKYFLKAVPIFNFFVAIILMIFLYDVPKGYTNKWRDIKKITDMIPYGSYMAYRGDMWNDWDLQTGLIRRNYITLTSDTTKTIYLITDSSQNTNVDSLKYKVIKKDFNYYRLYKKNQP